MKNIIILHVLFVDNEKGGGVREVVPKHLEYQSKIARVALLNCNDSNLEESYGKYDVYKLSKFRKICNLPYPYNIPDIVVFHAIYYPQYLDLYKECKNRNIPYIIVPHGSLTKRAQMQKWWKKIPANVLLFNRFINNASSIQFLIKGEMENSRKCANYILSGNGIDASEKKKKYDKNDEKFFKVIYIGRYDIKTKGIDLMIDAFELIKKFALDNEIKLVLYGTDYRNQKKKIEKIVKEKKLEKFIEINGPIWGHEKVEKICSSDVFIQTSRTEGQPLGLMEAIDIGIPCLVTYATNYGEIVSDESLGWCADINAESIADMIIDAYSGREKFSEISKREIDYSAKNFRWNRISYNTVEEYRKIVEVYKEKNNVFK